MLGDCVSGQGNKQLWLAIAAALGKRAPEFTSTADDLSTIVRLAKRRTQINRLSIKFHFIGLVFAKHSTLNEFKMFTGYPFRLVVAVVAPRTRAKETTES